MTSLEAILGIAAARALNAIPAGLLLAALAWLLQRLLAKHSSGLRFGIWFAALLAIAGLPFLPRFDAVQSAVPTHFGITLPNSWAVAIVGFWIATSLIFAVRLSLGIFKLRRLWQSCVPVDFSLHSAELRHTVDHCNSVRPLSICASRDVRVPTAVGFLKPMILIPEWTLQELSANDLSAIILHEFAHLQRRDDWTNLAQKAICTLFFFHPAVWWIERRLSLEREVACDELVLARTGDAHAYAECLVSLAERGIVRRSLAMAQAAVSHARELSHRLSHILARGNVPAPLTHKPRLPLVGVSALVLAGSVSAAPEWIEFRVPIAHLAIASVPAAPTVSKLADRSFQAKLVKQPARFRSETSKSRVLNASHRQSSPRKPLVLKVAARDATPPPQFLVLTQVTRYDIYGDQRVSFTLWRVTLPQGKRSLAQAEIIARSL